MAGKTIAAVVAFLLVVTQLHGEGAFAARVSTPVPSPAVTAGGPESGIEAPAPTPLAPQSGFAPAAPVIPRAPQSGIQFPGAPQSGVPTPAPGPGQSGAGALIPSLAAPIFVTVLSFLVSKHL